MYRCCGPSLFFPISHVSVGAPLCHLVQVLILGFFLMYLGFLCYHISPTHKHAQPWCKN